MRSFGLAVVGLLISGRALGQDAPRSMPTGGRSVLMGGTGVALGRDGSSPFLNPATIGAIDDTKLAFSVNLLRASLTNFNDFYRPSQPTGPFAGLNVEHSSYVDTGVDVLPTTLCLFFTVGGPNIIEEDAGRAGRQKLAVCFGQTVVDDFVVSSRSVAGASPTLSSLESVSTSEQLRKAAFGPTYAVHLTDDLAIGASLHAVVTQRRTQWRATTLGVDGQSRALTTALLDDTIGTSFDVAGLLGATWRTRPLTLGLALSLPAVHAFGDARLSSASQVVGAGAADATSTVGATGSFAASPPMRVDVGAGLDLGRTLLELDVGVSLPWARTYDTTLHGQAATVTGGVATLSTYDREFVTPSRAALGFAAGFEHKFTPTLGMVGGASAEITIDPSSLGDTPFHDYAARQNRVAASVGLGSYGNGHELLFGTELSYGFGKRWAPDVFSTTPSFAVVDAQRWSALFVIAGAASFQTIKQVVDQVKGVVVRPREEK